MKKRLGIFTWGTALTLLTSLTLLASPPKPSVGWVMGPDPSTRGGTSKLAAGHTLELAVTIAGKTRKFNIKGGTTGSSIGWWSFNKTHNSSTDIKWVAVLKKNGREIDRVTHTAKRKGGGTILNFDVPSRNGKFKMKARLQHKGPFHIYVKDPSSVGKEQVYILFTLA
jgi:hypothetical protein